MSCDKEMAIASGLRTAKTSVDKITKAGILNNTFINPQLFGDAVIHHTIKHQQNLEFFNMLAQITMLPKQPTEGKAERVRPNPNKVIRVNKTATRKPITKAVQASIARRKKKSS
jgi:hypothetical protein